MKKRQITTLFLLLIAILGLGYTRSDVMAATTSEAGNEASIEILEDYEPATIIPPIVKPSIKLPQTSDSQTNRPIIFGGLMIVGVAGIWWVKKRKEIIR